MCIEKSKSRQGEDGRVLISRVFCMFHPHTCGLPPLLYTRMGRGQQGPNPISSVLPLHGGMDNPNTIGGQGPAPAM